MRHRLHRVVAQASAAAVVVTGLAVGAGAPAPRAAAATTPALELLSRLPVREHASSAGFDPDQFRFAIYRGDGCTTERDVFQRDSDLRAVLGDGCSVASGRWTPYYNSGTARTYTTTAGLGIVQTVPPAEAWRSGAQSWSANRRLLFANDVAFRPSLVVAPVEQIRTKLGADPDSWGPPGGGSSCRYGVEWTQVKYRWGLSVDPRERDRLRDLLTTCRGVAVQVPVVVGTAADDTAEPAGDGSPAGTDRMADGQVLRSGEWLMSPSREYGVACQADGNLVAYGPRRKVLWSADTYGNPGATCGVVTNKGVVVTSRDGRELWRSGSSTGYGDTLRVQDDGNAVLHDLGGRAAWYTGWDRNGLRAGDALLPGQRITSANGTYFLMLQRDGNVVTYTAGGAPLWFSGSYGADRLVLQADGNLVAYGGAHPRPRWNSDTWRIGGGRLVVQDDGNAVIYRNDNRRAVWYSGWDRGQTARTPGGDVTVRGPGLA